MSNFLTFLYVTKLHQKFTWFSWPAMDFMNSVIGVLYMISISTAAVYHVGTVKRYITGDFIRCVSAAGIYFVVSLVAVSKYTRGASKAAAVLGFVATIVFAFDFYLIFNDFLKFLENGEPTGETEVQKSDDEELD